MQLRSGSNYLELKLVGYQYPHITNEQYDSNWLIVEGTVEHASGRWRFRDPCLLTWEAAELVGWLDALANKQTADSELGFIEPNLSFASLADGTLHVTFALEAYPPPDQLGSAQEDEYSLVFVVDAQSLRKAASELRAQLARLPRRVVQ